MSSSDSSDKNAWQEGQTILDDFEVLERAGQGALGIVYIVLDNSTGRRYAVKRISFANEEAQTRFLSGVEAWLYLPEHPNLVACRFVRLLTGSEVAVFIDAVHGPTLKDLIVEKRLAASDPARTLERILDLAIQFAWGLDAIHEMKVIHEDVKPGNVFVLGSNTVKVTDIGLARAAAVGTPVGQHGSSRVPGSIITYQALDTKADKPAAYTSDVWNFGATVMEMFAAGWSLETNAPPPAARMSNAEILAKLQQANAVQPPFPAVSADIAAIINRCFALNPSRGWSNMGSAADALRQVYMQVAKRPYPRRTPAPVHRGTLLSIAHARWQPGGGAQWTNPDEWMNKALGPVSRGHTFLLGKSLRMSGRWPMYPRVSRKQQAQMDMVGYVKAQRAFEVELGAGRKELEYLYAILLSERAFLHVCLEDLPKAAEYFDKTIKMLDGMVNKEGRAELANDLAMACLNHAVALKHLGSPQGSVAGYDKAIQIWERLVKTEGRVELTPNLAWVKALRGEALFQIADETERLAASLERRAEESNNTLQTQYAALAEEMDPAKVAERQRSIQEMAEAARNLGAQARETRRLVTERRSLARKEAPGALSLLRAEAKRTMRGDLSAILRWAETVFEGRL